MSLYTRVITKTDLEEILAFEKAKLQETILDEMEREMKSWNSRWRQESLEHYLPLGWSFLVRDRSQSSSFSDEGLLVGYFLAQPLLFFDANTQNLWLEHIQFSTLQARDELCELAYKMSREKHFQQVLFPESQSVHNAIKNFKSQQWDPQILMCKTTKV